jgi:hypothetical protein
MNLSGSEDAHSYSQQKRAQREYSDKPAQATHRVRIFLLMLGECMFGHGGIPAAVINN